MLFSVSSRGTVFGLLQKLFAGFVFVLVNGVRACVRLYELVVELGKLLFGNLIHLDCENGFLAFQVFSLIVVGETNGYILLVADFQSDDLLFETGYETAAAEDEVVLFRGAARKLFAVYRAGEVDVYFIAVFRRPVLDFDFGSVALQKLLTSASTSASVTLYSYFLIFKPLYEAILTSGFTGTSAISVTPLPSVISPTESSGSPTAVKFSFSFSRIEK